MPRSEIVGLEPTRQMVDESERRLEDRFDKVFSVHMQGIFGSTLGIVRNISAGGMFIETPDPFPLGSRMRVTFHLEGNGIEMVAIGEVAHLCFLNRTAGGAPRSLITGMGVRFVAFVDEAEPWNRAQAVAH